MTIGRTVATAIAIALIALLAWGANSAPEGTAGAGGELTIGIAAGEHWLRGAPTEAPPALAGEGAQAKVVAAPEPAEGSEPGADAESAGEGPQVAIWLQDPAGSFVATIFITRRAAVEDWGGVEGIPENETVMPRPLPVWAGKHRGIGIEPMAACGACHGKRRSEDKATVGDPILEARTGPSPSNGLVREWTVPEHVAPGAYGVRVEVNHWTDPNERYPDALTGDGLEAARRRAGSGQPSLVWGGTIEIGAGPNEGGLTLIGHGHPSGANGEVDPDLAGLTTALSIVDTIHVAYAPAE